MARYPVTVAQFRVFVEDSGYKPKDEYWLQGLFNHPVVNVTWYEALEYCKWLTEQLKAAEHVPEPLAKLVRDENWQVTLPSEAGKL
jgi:formylglycine-generating enzyme required for sulfatase activity